MIIFGLAVVTSSPGLGAAPGKVFSVFWYDPPHARTVYGLDNAAFAVAIRESMIASGWTPSISISNVNSQSCAGANVNSYCGVSYVLYWSGQWSNEQVSTKRLADSCRPGESLVNGNCIVIPTCGVGQELWNNTCVPVCVSGQTRDSSGVCQCPTGQDVYGGACTATCPANASHSSSGGCSCNSGYVKTDEGLCVETQTPKQTGEPVEELCTGNPVNAGTGDKFQPELIYSGTGASTLTYHLSYTSRKSADLYRPALAHGLYWTHGLERRLIPDSSSGTTGPNQVSSRRADGKLYGYTRQANGSYLADADITDR
ncbi:MAG: DUF6531 domain-containing protein, partial [Rhodocyclales bacterium]|nr:DUF6531 domain-containing protein [Rhodocyclales bacterium]